MYYLASLLAINELDRTQYPSEDLRFIARLLYWFARDCIIPD